MLEQINTLRVSGFILEFELKWYTTYISVSSPPGKEQGQPINLFFFFSQLTCVVALCSLI